PWAAARQLQRAHAGVRAAEAVLAAAVDAGDAGTRVAYESTPAMSPAQRRRKGAGETLRYAVTPCPLGLLLIAASDKGLCALLFGDAEAPLLEQLQDRFAAAILYRDQNGLGDWLHAIVMQL